MIDIPTGDGLAMSNLDDRNLAALLFLTIVRNHAIPFTVISNNQVVVHCLKWYTIENS